MAESTLSLTWDDLARETAFDLGWNYYATEDEGLSSSAKETNVNRAVKIGYRDFLNAHDWAFKRPRATMTLWSTKTGTVTTSSTTATATAPKFFSSMIGHDLLVEAIINGDFDADTDWTKGAGWTISGGEAIATGAISTDLSATVNPLTTGITFRVTFTISVDAGSITPVCGTASGTARSTSGTFTEDIACTSTAVFKFSTSGFTGTLDNVSVQAVLAITAYTSSTVVTIGSSYSATAKDFTVEADGVYRLPDNYGSMFSKYITFETGSNDSRVIKLTGEPLVTAALQVNDTPSRPTMAGIRPLLIGTTTGQRFDLVAHPVVDQDYLVNFRYEIHPDALATGNYPYGGMKHAEVIRKCCLAAAESLFNDHMTRRRDEARLALAIAIADDNRHNRSDTLGQTRNRQQRNTGMYREHEDLISTDAVTVHGVSYN